LVSTSEYCGRLPGWFLPMTMRFDFAWNANGDILAV